MRTFIRHGIPYQVKLSHWFPRYITRHDAVTWHRTIYVKDATLPGQLHCHEFQHIMQQESGRFRWLATYLWQGLTRGYLKIDAETQAYDAQRAYLAAGRTDFEDVS
jgi:hypothetical protein